MSIPDDQIETQAPNLRLAVKHCLNCKHVFYHWGQTSCRKHLARVAEWLICDDYIEKDTYEIVSNKELGVKT